MNFYTAMEYIEDKNKLGVVPGLDNIIELLTRLGSPQNKVKCLHIAGTNGKGSIFSFVENVLIDAGYKVGRYISPTIFEYLERFQINKNIMHEDTFAAYIDKVSKVIRKMEAEGLPSPTAFEIETAVAFLYFADELCDFCLIECGMGGTLDATNVIDNPLVCAFASISMDHMQFLGNSLSEIATNKAGIIRDNAICISAPQKDESSKVLKAVAAAHQCNYYMTSMNDVSDINYHISGTSFSYRGESYEISLLGIHQISNAITAIEIINAIAKLSCGDRISLNNIQNGLANTVWPGRMTKISENPYIFVDGAHNEDAWLCLRQNINKYFTNRRIIYIIGVLKDKEYSKMVDILCDSMEYAIAITPNSPRGLDKNVLAGLILDKNIRCSLADNCDEAMHLALDYATKDDVILVCGSLSFLKEYLTWSQ